MIKKIKAVCLNKNRSGKDVLHMKTKQILMAGALALSMVLSGGMLTGCSNSSTKDTKTTEVAKKNEVKTLGQKTKDSKSLKFTNNTGKKITVFETKSSSEESFSDNLLDNGDAVKNKEERTLYYEVKESDKLDVKIGLQDQDKTFVFKEDVDTTDTKKVDVSLKDDKVNLDVTKKDGSTATLTPSEDSAKTEDEKKDEQEVKQEEKKEEKKEETAKADSSNKSNTSESKKNNTASTTNTSSNKNNTGSSSKPSNNNSSNSNNSKPAEHTHNWVAQYKTVNVPEKGHNEQVLVQAAYDEQVPITEMKAHDICSSCGADLTGTDISSHVYQHMINGDDKGGHYTEWRETVVGYKTVHHDAVYETRYVVDSPATTKQELTGYKCSSCGKTKAN
jgi:hypothetical protein